MSISSSNTKKAQCAACDRQAGDAQCGFCAQKAKRFPPNFPDAASDAASVASTKKVGACIYCKEEGHVVADCPQLAAKKARAAKAKARAEWRCLFCNEKGHLVRNCPDKAAQKAAEAAYLVKGPRAATLSHVAVVTIIRSRRH